MFRPVRFCIQRYPAITPLPFVFSSVRATSQPIRVGTPIGKVFFINSTNLQWLAQVGTNAHTPADQLFTDRKDKVMFSQMFVCPQSASWLLAHCSDLLRRGRHESYWNAFLLKLILNFFFRIFKIFIWLAPYSLDRDTLDPPLTYTRSCHKQKNKIN